MPLKNKKKILEAYYTNEAYDLGFTMAGTMFLENRGKDTSYSNKNGRNKEILRLFVEMGAPKEILYKQTVKICIRFA